EQESDRLHGRNRHRHRAPRTWRATSLWPGRQDLRGVVGAWSEPVQAVRGALGTEEGVGEGGRARAVGAYVAGTHERARGGAAEVDRAQVPHVQGQIRLPVGRDAVGLAVPDGEQVAALLAEERVVDVEDELAVREPAARGQRTRDVQQPYPEPVGLAA